MDNDVREPFGGTLAVVLTLGLLLREHGPGNMGNGLLLGAAFGLALAAVMGWRLVRRPERVTTFEGAWSQTGDERDDAVLTRALAVLGLASFPLTAAAAIAIAFGASVEMYLALLLAEIGVGALAFAVIARRS
jgi:drug/metabolite transporter (DMT)-like permease